MMEQGIPQTVLALAEHLGVSESAARQIYDVSVRYGIERGYDKGVVRGYEMGRADERADVVAHARYTLTEVRKPYLWPDGSSKPEADGEASDAFDLFPDALLRGEHVNAAEKATDDVD